MTQELEAVPVEGQVLKNGIAQKVTRRGNDVLVELTCIPGARLPLDSSSTFRVELPEPVIIEAGGTFSFSIDFGRALTAKNPPFALRSGDVVRWVRGNVDI